MTKHKYMLILELNVVVKQPPGSTDPGEHVIELKKLMAFPFYLFPGLVLELPNADYADHAETGCGLDLYTAETIYWNDPKQQFQVEVLPNFSSVHCDSLEGLYADYAKEGWTQHI